MRFYDRQFRRLKIFVIKSRVIRYINEHVVLKFTLIFTATILFLFFFFENYQRYDYYKRKVTKIFTSNDKVAQFNADKIYSLNSWIVEFRFPDISFNSTKQGVKVGKIFDNNLHYYLDRLNLLNIPGDVPNEESVLNSQPIIITAVSSNHFRECLKFLKQLSRIYSKEKVLIIYDLGLSWPHRKILKYFYDDLIVEIREFEFNEYPEYVSNLREFRWKPLIIAETLKTYSSTWYFDTSIRIHKKLFPLNDNVRLCKSTQSLSQANRNCSYFPWILFSETGHSIYAATDKRIFEYLPMPESESISLPMFSTLQLVYGTKFVKEHVLRYFVLCALEKECMAPMDSLINCKFDPNDRYGKHAGCHRQDQSTINILLSVINNYNQKLYAISSYDALTIEKDTI